MNHKELLTLLKERRSIRAYRPDPIGGDALCNLLEAATWAPSGNNRQSWLFTALSDSEKLGALNAAVKAAFLACTPENDAMRYGQTAAAKEDYSFYYKAPTLIIASSEPHPNAIADCSCALQNIFLTAHAMGLGSCWINQLRWLTEEPSVRALLAAYGIPKDHMICGAASVGYPAHQPTPPARKQGATQIVP